MQTLFDDIWSGAVFSEDRTHRYQLWRFWDHSKPVVMFIGLNPSTANEVKPDPTIGCVTDFSKSWGYGGFYMMNLFSLVSSKPEALLTCDDPVRDNDRHLTEIAEKCKDVVFAWGGFKEASKRVVEILTMFPNGLCIDQNAKGFPVHPLWAGVYSGNKASYIQPKVFNSQS